MAKLKQARDASNNVFVGTGEMAECCRDLDWSSTPLGPVSGWSQSLRSTVSTLLASRNPMFLWWGEELIQFYNDAYRPSLGGGERQRAALGARGRQYWKEIWPTIGSQVDGVMTRGEAVWFEDAYIPIERNGTIEDVWWTYSYSPVRDDDGSIGGTLVICQETTGRVKAERRLIELNHELDLERSRLAQVFERAPSFFAIVRGPEHRFTLANEAYYGLVGRRDIIGKPVIEALPEIASQGFADLLDGVLRTGEAVAGREMPVKLARTHGEPPEERFVDFVYQPIADADGTASGVLAHGYDVTDHVSARVKMEKAADALDELQTRFRAVQDASPDASLLASAVRDDTGAIADFIFTYANAATTAMLLGRDEPIVGRTLGEVFPESLAAGQVHRLAHVVESGEVWVDDVQFLRGPLNRGLRITAVKVGDGVHVSAIDISERIHSSEERERLLAFAEAARRDAERANRAKSEFLAVMSHELRTPLNAIDGYAELLELEVHGPINPQQAQHIARIRKSQQHLLGLINGVLNYTRVEAGMARFDLAPVSVNDVLSSCEALLAPQMTAKGVSFNVEQCPLSPTALADSEKLQQIVLNLLTNAHKFTNAGGTVQLSCRPVEHRVEIIVQDTGRGIPTEQLERVFEPFVQVDARLTRTEQGVGLGLAISRDLARGMDGEIHLVSEVGKGSTFTVTLPRP